MKNYRDPLTAALGVLLVLAGLWQVRAGGSVLGYVCIGLGCGLFGHGTGELVARWSMRNDPALQKEQEILRRDERNVAIARPCQGPCVRSDDLCFRGADGVFRPDGGGSGCFAAAGVCLPVCRGIRRLLPLQIRKRDVSGRTQKRPFLLRGQRGGALCSAAGAECCERKRRSCAQRPLTVCRLCGIFLT